MPFSDAVYARIRDRWPELLCHDGRLDGEAVWREIQRIDWWLRLAAENGTWDGKSMFP